MEKHPSAFAIYKHREDNQYTECLALTLKKKVIGEALEKAANHAIERYPYLAMEIVLNQQKTDYQLISNTRPIIVSKGKQPKNMCTAETNYHIMTIRYEDCTIYFDAMHAFMDGVGLFEWVKTVLYYYLCDTENKELDATGIKTLKTPISREEATDPMLDYVSYGGSVLGGFTTAEPAISSKFDMDNYQYEPTFCGFRVDEKTFIHVIKQKDGSPNAFMSAIVAKAYHNLFPQVKRPVVNAIAVNYRAVMENQSSYASTVGTILVKYPKSILEKELKELTTIARGAIMVQSEESNLRAKVNKFYQTAMRFRKMNTLEERIAGMTRKPNTDSSKLTSSISYVGKISFHALESYIEAAYPYLHAVEDYLLIEMCAMNGYLHFSVMQSFADDTLIQEIVRILTENGVKAEDYRREALIAPIGKLPQ